LRFCFSFILPPAATITREIQALVNGKSCPQLTSYYGSVVVGTKLWIVMEFLDGGSVLDKVESLFLSLL
jgi:serine/threonine protein kinase